MVMARELTRYSADPLFIIDDLRFPNEAKWVRERGGHVVRLINDPYIQQETNGHVSEQCFDDLGEQILVHNAPGDLRGTVEMIRTMVEALKDSDTGENK